jgi:hypothetical protein
MNEQDQSTGIDDAIKAAGTQEALAQKLGCKQQLISAWKRRGYVSTRRVVEVEQMTGVARDRLINPRLKGLLDTTGI